MGRRQYGTGTIYQREDGLWIGRAEAGWTPKGTRRRVSVSGKTEAEVKKKLREKLRKINDDQGAVVGKKYTVKSWSEEWLEIHKLRVRPNQHLSAKSRVKKWIVPTLGTRRLDQLTPADARALEKAILDAGLSLATAKLNVVTLRTMLKDARIEGHVVPSGILDMRLPEVPESDRDAMPVEDAIKLLRTAENTNDFPRWVLAFFQGMRQAEVTGLTWSCVDLEARTIDVSWQLKFIAEGSYIAPKFEVRHLNDNYYLMRPKTKAGRRTIPLSPLAWAALKKWREVAPKNPWDLVFTATDRRWGKGNAIIPRDERRDREAWYDLQKAAGVQKGWKPAKKQGAPDEPVYWLLHEVRHTAATMLLSQGVEPMIAASILGQRKFVESYAHLNAEHTRTAVETLDSAYAWNPTPEPAQIATISP